MKKILAWFSAKRIVSMLVILAITASIIVGCGFGFGWFNGDNTIDNDGMLVSDISATESDGYSISLNYKKSTGETLTATATTSSTYTFTVTVLPSTATNAMVDLTLAWASTSSETLASYVTISQSLVESGDTVTVTCKQAFGTQVILTATSNYNTSVKTTATLDYVKRVTGATISSPSTVTFSSSSTTHNVTITPTYGTGTVTPDVTITDGTLKSNVTGTSSLVNVVVDGTTYCYYTRTATTNYTISFDGSSFSVTTPYAAFVTGTTTNYIESVTWVSTNYVSGIKGKNASSGSSYSSGNKSAMVDTGSIYYPTVVALTTAFNNGFVNNITGTTSDGTLTVNYTYSYNGTTYGSSSVSCGVAFDGSSLVVAATGVELNETAIYF